jgi:hypothetical protein
MTLSTRDLTAELFDLARAIAEAALDAAGADGLTKQRIFLRDLTFSRVRKAKITELVQKINKKGKTNVSKKRQVDPL